MSKEKFKDVFIRAVKTFAQAFLSAISIDRLVGLADFGAFKKVGASLLIGGAAAGISAAWNALVGLLPRETGEKGARDCDVRRIP